MGVLKDIVDTLSVQYCPHKLKDIPNYQESLEYSGMDVSDISQFDDVILSVLQVLFLKTWSILKLEDQIAK